MKLVQSSLWVRRLALALLALLAACVFGMTLLPWQQTAWGTGRVVAFDPQERQQTITSPVKGIVVRVGTTIDGAPLYEGAFVTQGQTILEIEPNAENLVEQLQAQRSDLTAKLATAEAKADVYRANIVDFTAVQEYATAAAQEMVDSAGAKLQAKKDLIAGYQAKELQARLNYERQKRLFEQGVKAEKEVEKLRKDWDVAQSDLLAAQREAQSAQNYLAAKQAEVEQKRRETQTKIDYARAMLEDAKGQAATTRKETRDVEVNLTELDRLVIRAPRSGTIFRLPVFERAKLIKEGDPLFTLVPEATETAVELSVLGNDMPLVQVGDRVRLQFEGWPAVQFSGWPSVAVGTFGGKVAAMDATDDGAGKFRMLVKADPEDDAWPSDRYLRQGVRVNGWVLLSQVSLGYELWRQLNGFPPVISKEEPTSPKDVNSPKFVK